MKGYLVLYHIRLGKGWVGLGGCKGLKGATSHQGKEGEGLGLREGC